MVQHATSAGANALIAMRYDANEITDAGLTATLRAACQRGGLDAKGKVPAGV